MTVHVLSFDFDGCLCNNEYRSNGGDIIGANQKLLKEIKKTNHAYSKVITFVGSNRQSYAVDQVNMNLNDTASCFIEIPTVAREIESEFDPFLLADIYGVLSKDGRNGDRLPHGTSFNRAVKKNNDPHASWRFDEGKLTILYAQIHKMAKKFPDEQIIFDFYDDKNEILKGLNVFFDQYPQMLPDNVTLNLLHYDGVNHSKVATIQGKGICDSEYESTVIAMAQENQNKYSVDGITKSMNTLNVVKPNLLRDLTILPERIFTFQFYDKFDEAMQHLFSKLEEWETLNNPGKYDKAYKTTSTLIETLADLYKSASDKQTSLTQFKEGCINAINTARPELEKHRGMKQILGNLALAIAGLGVFYVAAGLINMLATGGKNFLFFKTNSGKHLEHLEAEINSLPQAGS